MKLVIVAAPTSVIFDQALPIVASLKSLHPDLEVLCLYPNPGSISGARPNWTPIRMLEELGATSAYPITPLRWMPTNHLTLPGGFRKFVAKASRLAFAHLYPIGRIFRALVSVALLTLASLSQHQTPRKIETLTRGCDFVIWDLRMISKEYMRPLLYLLRTVPSYSIKHGLNPSREAEVVDCLSKTMEKTILEKITLYAMSLDEVADYKELTGLSNTQIRPTGTFRHHPEWIRALTSERTTNDGIWRQDCILVISRGYSSPNGILPRERMVGYLQDIKTVSEARSLRVIIKPHPKETDLSPHIEVFGGVSRDVDWEISDLHLAELAQRALFAVSFFSGSCLDLTAYGIPTIEFLDLVGLPEYDVPSAARDSTGAPVSPWRQDGHVLGASTTEEFFCRVEEVIGERRKVMRNLEKAYFRHLIYPPISPLVLAQQISESWLELSREGPSRVSTQTTQQSAD